MSQLEKLRHALLRGDKEKVDKAFALLYGEYKNLVIYVLSGLLNRKEDIEDCLNETFLELYKKAFEVKGSVKSFLGTVAKNKALDLLRKRKYECSLELQEGKDVGDLAIDPSPSNSYLAFREYCLSIVGEEDLSIIERHLQLGEGFAEIASSLGLTESGAKTRYHRALRKIRKDSEEEGK